ncbi:hypothetical protein DF186_23205, partial [Enterococcus hirae]
AASIACLAIPALGWLAHDRLWPPEITIAQHDRDALEAYGGDRLLWRRTFPGTRARETLKPMVEDMNGDGRSEVIAFLSPG